MKAHRLMAGLLALALVLLSGCAVTDIHGKQRLDGNARWVALPISNYAEAPQAGERASAILVPLLAQRGIKQLANPPAADSSGGLPDLDQSNAYDQALSWARSNGYQYGVTGSVTEWEYKTGLDGEPAVGVSLRVVDIKTGDTLWSAAGSKAGWGYSTLSGTAQKLMGDLVGGLPVRR